MLKAIHCNTNECALYAVSTLDGINRLIDDESQILWLDLYNPTETELTRIAEEFQLHPLAIEDATHEHQRPKFEQYESFFFVVFYAIGYDKHEKQLNVRELNLFVGKNYLITVHYTPFPELIEAESRWKRNPRHLTRGIGTLLYSVLDTIVDQYFPVLDTLVNRFEVKEDRIFAGEAKQSEVTFELLELKKSFLEFRRIVAPERDVLNVLTNRDSLTFSPSILVYFRDVYDHLSRAADTVDLYRDQLTGAMDASLAVASNQLNHVMRTLTATSIILMSNSLIASIYGMNFDFMPELKLQWGYPGVLAMMVVVTFSLLLYFKKLRWL